MLQRMFHNLSVFCSLLYDDLLLCLYVVLLGKHGFFVCIVEQNDSVVSSVMASAKIRICFSLEEDRGKKRYLNGVLYRLNDCLALFTRECCFPGSMRRSCMMKIRLAMITVQLISIRSMVRKRCLCCIEICRADDNSHPMMSIVPQPDKRMVAVCCSVCSKKKNEEAVAIPIMERMMVLPSILSLLGT